MTQSYSFRNFVRFAGSASLLALTIASTGCTAACWGGKALFNGEDLSGWRSQHDGDHTWQVAGEVEMDEDDETKLEIESGTGILVNGEGGKTINLVSEAEHGDCELHIEFMVPRGSNSGVYLMGRYEIQILDSYGKSDEEVIFSDCGGIYARWINDQNMEGHAPMVNASRRPGCWQSYDVVFKAPRFDAAGKKIANARFVSVCHNGKLIHKNLALNGPTRAGVLKDEGPSGPLMLQGDHGPVAFRNVWIKSLRD